jgi:hypothetical protein
MKFILPVVALVGVASAQTYDDVQKCIYERCPTESAKCDAKCEDKLRKCADKCGLQVNQTCWGGCVGLFGPATNVALCAANKGCLSSAFDVSFEQLGKYIDSFLNQ